MWKPQVWSFRESEQQEVLTWGLGRGRGQDCRMHGMWSTRGFVNTSTLQNDRLVLFSHVNVCQKRPECKKIGQGEKTKNKDEESGRREIPRNVCSVKPTAAATPSMSEGPPAQAAPRTGAGFIPSQRDWSPAHSVGKNGRLRNGTRCRVKCSSVYRSAHLGGGGRGRASARTWGAGGVVEGEEEPGWGCHTAFHSRASYLPFVPFDPFPSTRFIVSFTLLRPGSRKKRRWRRGQGGVVDERHAGTAINRSYVLHGDIGLCSIVARQPACFQQSGKAKLNLT